jgi:trigger factor
LVEKEVEDLLESFTHDLSHQNMDLDTYLKLTNTDKESFVEKTIRPTAIRQLERSLVINEVSKVENVQLNPREVEAIVAQTIQNMQQSGEIKTRKQITNDLANAITYDAANRVMNRTVLNLLKAYATGAMENLPPAEAEVIELPAADLPDDASATIDETPESESEEILADPKEEAESED